MKNELEILQIKKQKLSDTEEKLSKINKEIEISEILLFDTNKKKRDIEKTIAEKFKVIVLREDFVDKKEKEIDDKILKNGIMVTRIEKDQRVLELYVKRLQKHYDTQGININILNEFGIKRDNI